MQLSERDIVAAHAVFGRPDEVLDQTRSLYLVAAELASGRRIRELPVAVLDNPAARGHLGAVLCTGGPLADELLRPVDELLTAEGRLVVDGLPVRLASAPAAPGALVGAVGRISDELRRHGVDLPEAWLLTGDAPGFAEARRHLVDGVRLALDVAPELTRDLLSHVTLVAVLAQEAGRLGSASAREYPGLVMLPPPRSAREVAEALVHEGAHQRLFGLMQTRAILGPADPDLAFTPSWAAPGAPPWRMEQCLAAFHAYCCLGAVADRLGGGEPADNPFSLLPRAARRAAEIGDWLLRHAAAVQPDGHVLLGRLTGRAPAGAPAALDLDALPDPLDASTVMRRCGARTLLARGSFPADLVWVRSDLVPADSGQASASSVAGCSLERASALTGRT